MTAIVPIPRSAVTVRPAAPADLPFIDGLQKLHARMVGWMPTKQIEGKIAAGHVVMAEGDEGRGSRVENRERRESDAGPPLSRPSILDPRPSPSPLGYCIAHDQYFKRDDVGIVYQLNVAPGRQRGLIGATLLKAVFDRAAYGCRLFCCWCAQDIEANRFWESMGFIPLAYRAGSREKGRVHIFWQRRVRAGDTATPYWFPAQTNGGSIREDRLVLPIPPGKWWGDAMPVVLPDAAPAPRPCLPGTKKKTKDAGKTPVPRKNISISTGGLWFAPPPAAAAGPKAAEPKPKREPKPKVKNDPKLVAAARELRDRWLERVNADPTVLLEARAKYDVSRALGRDVEAAPAAEPRQIGFQEASAVAA